MDGITSVIVNKEKGFISFLDSSSHVILVYSAPILHCGKETVAPDYHWKPESSELVIDITTSLPSSKISFPLSLAFVVSPSLPKVDPSFSGKFGFGFGFGSKKKGEKKAGGDDSDSDSDNETKARKKVTFRASAYICLSSLIYLASTDWIA